MGYKLLLADDSITIQKVIGIIFANEEYELTLVDNGNAAIEKARALIPDVALIDALMPGRNGYEVCSEFRRDGQLQRVPILLMTGAFEPFDEEKARTCGADDTISKPFESQQLIDKVKALIALGKERAAAPPPLQPVAPQQSPAVQAEPAPAVAPAVAAMQAPIAPSLTPSIPVAPVSLAEEEFFAIEEAGDDDLFAAELTDVEEVVEVSPDADPWGAFEIEDVHEEEAFGFAEEIEAPAVRTSTAQQPVAPQAAEDFFFVEEAPAGIATPEVPAEEFFFVDEEIGASKPAEASLEEFFFGEEQLAPVQSQEPSAAPEFAQVPSEATEQFVIKPLAIEQDPWGTEFSFAEEAPEPSPSAPSLAIPTGGEADMVFAPEEEFVPAPAFTPPPMGSAETVTPFLAAEPERLFAPEEEYVPAPPVAPSAPAGIGPTPAPPVTVTRTAEGEITLTEAQLAALVSRISRDVIERIAWEVVPDLAETIILEEIRKIKEG